MNHIYKVIWNKTTQSLVVVSELAASRSKTKSSKRRAKKITQETIELFTKTVGTLTLGSAVLSSAPVVLTVGAAAIFKPSQAEAYVNNVSYARAANYSVAIGANTTANYTASAMGGESVAIGGRANSSGYQSLAIGTNTTASGDQSISIGSDVHATGYSSIAIGSDDLDQIAGRTIAGYYVPTGYTATHAAAAGAIVLGARSVASGRLSTILGSLSTASADGATVLGSGSNASGQSSTIVGFNSTASAVNATVVGSFSVASASNAIAIGTNSKAVTENTTAIGSGAYTQGYNSTAIGMKASTWENNGVAIGSYANATGVSAISVGTNSIATETGSAAYGMNANASNVNALAIGTGTQAKSRDSVAIGNQSVSAEVRGVAIGTNANVASAADDGIAIGTNAVANGKQAIAAGLNASASANNTVALGSAAQALAENAISIGTGNIVTGKNSGAIGDPTTITGSGTYSIGNNNGVIAADDSGVFGNNNDLTGAASGSRIIGNDSSVSASDGFVMGNRAQVKGEGGVAVGNNAIAEESYDMAIGYSAKATGIGGSALAVGTNAKASGTNAVGIGNGATATNTSAIALGGAASGYSSTALGYVTKAEGTSSTAVGYSANAKGAYSTAVGSTANASGTNSISIGGSSSVSSSSGVAIGTKANTTGTEAIALGANANSTVGGGVALGANSQSIRDASAATPYIPETANALQSNAINATKATTGAVSVGSDTVKRQIINVAAGSEDSDAVNVAQLKAAVSSTSWSLQNNGVQKDEIKSGDTVNFVNGTGTVAQVTGNSTNSTVKYSVDMTGLNVASDGTVSAVKNGDKFATAEQVAKAINDSEKTTTVNSTNGTIAATATTSGTVTNYDLDLSQAAKDSLAKADSALQSWTAQVNGSTAKVVNQTNNTVNFVNGTNTVVSADASGNISVSTAENVTFNTVNASTFNAGDVSISNNGINAGGKTVTNVANGTKDSDAVNFSQLNATNTNVANNAQNITNNANNISNNTKAIANNTQNITTNANNIAANTAAIKQGFNIGADNGNDDNVQLGETVNYNGDSNIITTVSNNAIAFALNSSIAVDNVTVNNTFKAGDVTINNAGIDAGNHAITNVTAGTNATDAVNVAQLNASQSSVKAGDNVNVTSAKDANGTVYTVNANTSTVSNGSDKVTVTKTDAGNHTSNYAVDLSQSAKDSLTKADSALQSLTTSADGTTAQTLNQENSNANFISGNNIQLTPSANGITVATKADVTFTNVTATNVNGNTVTIGSGANTTTLTSTAEGLDMGGDKLTNISAGTNKTDAVNLGQLEKYIGDNSYNWNLSDGTNSNAVADNSTVAIKGSANADSAKTAGIVTALDGTNVSVDLSDKTKSDIQQGVDANTTVNSKGITFAADSGTPTERKLGDTLAVNGDGDLINTTASAGKIAVAATDKLKDAVTNATSALQSVVTQIDGKDVKTLSKADNKANFVSGDNISLTNDGQGGIKIATKENVTFNTVNASTFNAGDVSISNNGINAGGKTVTNVANGTKDSDAVNFSQLNATNTNVANNAQNITNNANNITNNTNAINKGINFGNGTTATKFNLGDTINVTSDSNLVVSTVTDGVKLTLADSIAVGNVTVNNTFKAGDVTINNSGINAGNHAITNVTAGTNATDAVNVGQLEKYVGDNAYNWNLSDGTNTNAVADNSTVAIKGSANADSAKTAGIVTALDGTNVSVDLSEQTKSDIQQGVNANTTVSKGFNIGADNGNDDNVQLGETVNYNGDSNIITTVSNNAIAFALNSSIAVDNVTVNNTLKAGDVTINNSGIDAGNHAITNVTAGTNATDAVNVAQLNASQSSVKAGDNVNVTSAKDANGTVYTVNANTSTVSNGSDKVTVTKTDAGNHTSNYAVDLSDAAKSSLTKADSALQSLTTSADGTTAQTLNQENSNANFISGNNIQLTPSANGITVATKADVTFTNVTATNVNGNTVTIGSGANTTTLTSTAEGLDVGGDKLTNISAGTNKTDAVNLGQLEKYIGDNSYNWNLSDGTTSNAVADNSTVAIKGSANADSAKTAGIVTALDGTNVSVDLSDKTKSDIQQGVNANTTVSKGFNIGADNGNDDNVQLGETVNYNGDSNIITTVSNNAIAFALNPSLNLTDAGSVTMGDVVVNNGGITIANGSTNNQAVSLTKDGLNNGGNKITNVANGTQDSDAVNLAQLNASQSSVKAGDNVNVTSVKDANGTVYTVNANTSTVSNGSDKVTVTKTDAGNHTSNYAVDLSQSAKDSLTKADSALQSWTAQVNGADAKVVNQTNNTVNFVNGTNTVVSADASGNISVSTAENVTFNTVNASTFNAGDVSISNNGINAGDKVVTNVANGTQDSDAVNFSQLNATNTNVANNAQNITNNANAIANNTQNITNNTNAINKGINFGNGTSANKFALGSTINVKPSDSNLVVKTVADGVELALADSIAVSNVTVNNTLKAGDVTINNSGIDAGNHAITNVTAGTNATDAVNLGQLEKYIGDNSYNWNLSDGTNSNAVADNSTVAIKGSANADSAKTAGIVTALDGTNVSVDLSEQTKSDIQQGVDANTTVNNKGITFAADSGAATERKLGETLTVNGDNDLINTTASAGKLEVAATDKLKEAVTNATSALQSVVTQIDGKDVKTLSKADNKANFVSSDNISLTNDGQGGIKVATKDNVTFTTVNATTFNAGDVSISNNGINAGGKTVTNVANGTQDSDAVNLSQLNATNTNVANNAQNITNNANNITNNTNAINKGINFGNGTSANNFALGSTINVTSDSNLVVSTVTDGVKLTLADSITVGNVTVNDTFKAGDVTINSAGIDAGDHAITNVTAGTNATDAVNVAQLEANTTRYYSVNSTATGNRKNDGATGANAMAAGANATASGDNATAIGQGTKANSASAIAIGNNANATSSSNDSVIAIGNNAQSTGSYSIAVGTNSVASNTWSMAMGISAKATGDYATGLGSNAQATAQWTTALGAGANATESAATAVGSNATAGADGATVIGYNSSVTGANTTALGNNINVGTEGSVVLGNNSAAATATTETAATVNNLTYSGFAGAGNVVAGDYVSVGSAGQERQIKYVTPGNISATSTDAINGSQLYATNRVLGNVANSVVNNFGGNAAVDSNGNITFTDIGGTGETTIHDAIKNVSDVANTGWNVQTNGDTATKVAPGDTVQFKDGKNIKITRTDKDITVATADDVSFNSITAGPVTINSNGIDAGSQKITNVATGTNGTDAVNLDQLNQTISANAYNWNISDGTKKADVPDNSTVSVKGSANADSAKTAGIVTALDGTNVSVDLSEQTKSDIQQGVNANTTVSKGFNIGADKGTDDNVQLGETVNYNGDSNIITTVSDNAIAFALNSSLNLTDAGSVTMGDVVVNNGGITIANGTTNNQAVSLTKDGLNNGGNKITNVANGTQDSDAVNLAQLNASQSSVKAGDNVNVTSSKDANGTVYTVNANTSTVSNGSDKVTVTKTDAGNHTSNYAVDLSQSAKDSLTKADSALQSWTAQVNGAEAKVVNQTSNTVNFVNGTNTVVSADASGNISVSTAENVTFNTVNASTFNAGDVSISSNGINAGGKTVTNVANGTKDSDAVNLSQLNATNTNVANNAQNITNNANAIANNTQNITNNTNAINKGINFGNGTSANNFALGSTINVKPSDSNLVVKTVADGVELALADSIAVGNVTVNNTFKAGDVTINNAGIDAGNHTITNVTAGTNATDAVNFGQLKDYVSDNSYNWNLSDGTNSNAVADNSTVAIKGSANADSAKTAGIVTALDGTNVSVDLSEQTKSDIQQGVDANTTVNNKGITFAADSGAATERKLGESLAVNGDGDLINTTASAGKIEVAATDKLKNAVTNATSALQSVVTQIDGKDVKTLSKADNKANFVSGDNISLTDDGQGGIKIATKADVTFTNVTATNIKGNTVTISSGENTTTLTSTKEGLDVGGDKITNVANGTQDSDAVNLSQLNASTSANAWKITGNNADNATTVGKQTVSFNNGTNTVAVVNGTNVTFNLADNITLTNKGSMTIGSTVITSGNIKVGNNVAVTETGFTAGNVSVTTSGINAGGKTITNVARGVADDDAVNVSQLNEVKKTANAGWNLTANGQNSSNVAPNATVDLANKDGNINITKSGNNVAFDLSDKLNIGSGANTVVIDGTTGKVSAGNVSIGKDGISAGGQTITNVAPGVNGTDAVNVDQLRNFTSSVVDKPLTFAGDTGTPSERKMGSTVTVKGGVSDTAKLTDNNIGVVSDGQGSLNVKLAKDLTGLNSVTISNGSASTKLTTVTKKNVEGKEASALDVGGNQITNVAPGEVSKDSTDAVNGSQLHATNQQVIRNANAINQVAGQVHSVDRKLRAGVAGALASGGLYHATMPGKSMVAAGAGTYRGESAIAVGYSRLSDNGKLGVKFSVNSNTRGDTGAAASVGYQW
ncbi:YadA-like family protein [Bisgaard Taxon 10/6]|uniref:YadA-like family protein n=1 Tax=Exercitatus varius TaxID=67857 RepID=UPI00294AC45E|nr:YadA-like family protein [Exercitatus varius]MDG2916467.1 YadA-like family protein [Exercitatus varius]